MNDRTRALLGHAPTPIGRDRLDAPVPAPGSDTTRTLRCRTVAKSLLRQDHHFRDLPDFGTSSAEDREALERDNAPDPTEMLLAAFGSCLVIGIHANAVARSIPINSLELEISADINRAALWGTEDLQLKPIGFEVITVIVHIEAEAPRPVLKSLVEFAMMWSPVANTLHGPIHLDIKLGDHKGSTS